MAAIENNGVPSLEELSMPACFTDPKALAQIPHFDPDTDPGLTDEEIAAMFPDYDVDLKDINYCIYDSCLYSSTGFGYLKVRRRQLERMKSLLGLPDDKACMDWFETHGERDPIAGEKLIADALSTGKWKELPDELQPVYWARMGAAT